MGLTPYFCFHFSVDEARLVSVLASGLGEVISSRAPTTIVSKLRLFTFWIPKEAELPTAVELGKQKPNRRAT